jgi:GABA(A) receptor-associated protein
MTSFKEQFCKDYTTEQRIKESSKVIKKFPDKIPTIICEGDATLKLDKHKFLVPRDLTVGQLMYVVRGRLGNNIGPEKALYLSVANTIAETRTMLFDIYTQYKAEDGFLYLVIYGENTFGNQIRT